VLTDTRKCEQCGALFVPRREHARFCSVPCRAAWNSEHIGDLAAGTSALVWSATAMSESTQLLSQTGTADLARGLTLISEAVWWVTIVDATLVRHHPAPYDRVMAGQAPAQREQIEATLAGLRFVRNQIGGGSGLGEFAEPGPSSSHPGEGRVTGWRWRPVPESVLGSLPPRGRTWQKTRYKGYQAQLAGQTIGETIGRATAFLKLAAANATAVTETGGRGRWADRR
jgi:hypothetical protein